MTQNQGTVLVVLAILLLVAALMAWGWRGRARSQGGVYDELPPVPAEPGELVLPPLTGVYVGSTVAGYWQERIARSPLGFRTTATLTAHTGGLLLDLGRDRVWIPRERLVGVRVESKLANKVVPGGGLLVVRWQVGGPDGAGELDSGLRADDRDDYPRWTALTGDATPVTGADEPNHPAPTSEETQ